MSKRLGGISSWKYNTLWRRAGFLTSAHGENSINQSMSRGRPAYDISGISGFFHIASTCTDSKAVTNCSIISCDHTAVYLGTAVLATVYVYGEPGYSQHELFLIYTSGVFNVLSSQPNKLTYGDTSCESATDLSSDNPLLKPTGIQIATKSLQGPTTPATSETYRRRDDVFGYKPLSTTVECCQHCISESELQATEKTVWCAVHPPKS